MECGRKLGTYLRKRHAMRREAERRDVFERYIGEIAKAVHAISGQDPKKIYEALLAQARKRTAIADQALDQEGKRIKDDPAEQEGVIIVESAIAGAGPGAPASGDGPIMKLSKAQAAALKVAAMAKDEEPTLLGPGPGTSARGSKAAGKVPARSGRKSASAAPRTPTAPPPPVPAPAVAGKPTKPKMRLVNGKLVPADNGPTLF